MRVFGSPRSTSEKWRALGGLASLGVALTRAWTSHESGDRVVALVSELSASTVGLSVAYLGRGVSKVDTRSVFKETSETLKPTLGTIGVYLWVIRGHRGILGVWGVGGFL